MVNLPITFSQGICQQARFVASPNFDERPANLMPEVIIIHSISLPPGDYQSDAVEHFFCNKLDKNKHPYFEGIHHLTVSAHFFIRRDAQLMQFVNTNDRAWHAGVSECLGKNCVNDFSIGIELEGWDEADDGFSEAQYSIATELVSSLVNEYNIPVEQLYRHSDIAPERKNDPGPYFKWQWFCESVLVKVNS